VSNCKAVDGEWEFQSGAFDNASPMHEKECPHDMSVVLSDSLEALSRVPHRLPANSLVCAADPDAWGVAALDVGFLRHVESLDILRTPNDDEPAHGDVRGKKAPKCRRRMKKNATWVVQPSVQPE
jgi:hypothetical protein